ncbi:hypothetical protein [Lihuaxuella thermophila]|uniref:Uncharacterized protein n=1 Tax=Lihuaxuella thermophila TaxID=1173111 RepID=A0A1H8AUF4_9BACL|nr:hypothetical protein [Lihuaxuella thermophila]SEM74441.1 hypothetical protein SAMN05444955_101364 [Lihuaxuella thermophila]
MITFDVALVPIITGIVQLAKLSGYYYGVLRNKIVAMIREINMAVVRQLWYATE